MNEEEARNALIELHQQYMKHPLKERLKLYDQYQKSRGEIRDQLIKFVSEQKQENFKSK